MKYLIIGNGFDIAHGLKTKYSDFYNFLKGINNGEIKIDDSSIINLVKRNAFIQYIVNEDEYDKEFWSDLEELLYKIVLEISKLLEIFGQNNGSINLENYKQINQPLSEKILRYFSFIDPFIEGFCQESNGMELTDKYYSKLYGIKWKNVKTYLTDELDGLKVVLIYYLKNFIASADDDTKIIKQIDEIKPDKIVTFNYTDTYKRYGYDSKDVIHVHGSLENEKIVLGFDDKIDIDINYIEFIKYFQRIKYKTKSIFSEDAFSDKHKSKDKYQVYFYGLSLDIKDRDLIKPIIENAEETFIFYLENNEYCDYEQKVINLIKLFNKEFIEKNVSLGKIAFKPIVS